MKAIKATELNSFELCALRDYVQSCIADNIKAISGTEDTEWYKDCTFEDYQDNIIQTIYDHDDEELGEGISALCFNVLILDKKDSKLMDQVFIEARDIAYKEYEEELNDE